MCGRLDTYILSFSNLQTAKDKYHWASISNYRSPEKPVFLLVVINHLAHGKILRNFISPTNDLQETYSEYLSALYPDLAPPCITIPLTELGKTTFWDILPKPHAKNVKHPTYSTVDEFKADFYGAKFSDDLFMLLQMEHSRKKLCTALINSHFNNDIRTTIKALIK